MASELAFRMREDGYLMQINQLREENNDLRLLVDGLRYCAKASHGRCAIRVIGGDEYVMCCPLYDTGSGQAKCESLMRKLEIEVR